MKDKDQSEGQSIKEYEIWIEGFAITGNRGEASFITKAKGKNFRDAVLNAVYPDNYPLRGKPLKVDNRKENPIPALISQRERELIEYSNIPRDWGCKYFDNETDARKSFG